MIVCYRVLDNLLLLQPLRLEIKVLKSLKSFEFTVGFVSVSGSMIVGYWLVFLNTISEETCAKIRKSKIRGSASNRAMVYFGPNQLIVPFLFSSFAVTFTIFISNFWNVSWSNSNLAEKKKQCGYSYVYYILIVLDFLLTFCCSYIFLSFFIGNLQTSMAYSYQVKNPSFRLSYIFLFT